MIKIVNYIFKGDWENCYALSPACRYVAMHGFHPKDSLMMLINALDWLCRVDRSVYNFVVNGDHGSKWCNEPPVYPLCDTPILNMNRSSCFKLDVLTRTTYTISQKLPNNFETHFLSLYHYLIVKLHLTVKSYYLYNIITYITYVIT